MWSGRAVPSTTSFEITTSSTPSRLGRSNMVSSRIPSMIERRPRAPVLRGDRRVVGLAADLVDLVDIDDAALGALDVVVGGLQQLEDDVLDLLADIAGFGERGRVCHGEGHIEDARERLRQQRLARAGRADQQDVRLRELDVVVLGLVVETLVVIMDRDREHLLGVILADDIVVENFAYLFRGRNAVARLRQRGFILLADNVHAQLDALVADEYGRAGDELAHLVLALAAERAMERFLGFAAADLVHLRTPTRYNSSQPQPRRPNQAHARSRRSTTRRRERWRSAPASSIMEEASENPRPARVLQLP